MPEVVPQRTFTGGLLRLPTFLMLIPALTMTAAASTGLGCVSATPWTRSRTWPEVRHDRPPGGPPRRHGDLASAQRRDAGLVVGVGVGGQRRQLRRHGLEISRCPLDGRDDALGVADRGVVRPGGRQDRRGECRGFGGTHDAHHFSLGRRRGHAASGPSSPRPAFQPSSFLMSLPAEKFPDPGQLSFFLFGWEAGVLRLAPGSASSTCARVTATCAKATAACARPTAACARATAAWARPAAVWARPTAVWARPTALGARATAVCARPTAVRTRPTAVCARPTAVWARPAAVCSRRVLKPLAWARSPASRSWGGDRCRGLGEKPTSRSVRSPTAVWARPTSALGARLASRSVRGRPRSVRDLPHSVRDRPRSGPELPRSGLAIPAPWRLLAVPAPPPA